MYGTVRSHGEFSRAVMGRRTTHAARNHPGENGEASTTSGFLYGSCSSRPEVALRRDPPRHCPCGSNAAAAASASSPLTPAKSRRRPTRSPAAPLVKALARAWRWQRQLDDGVYTSVSEIGDAENSSKSYISRILRLALLAPDIMRRPLWMRWRLIASRILPCGSTG
jgi:hypothetical protein